MGCLSSKLLSDVGVPSAAAQYRPQHQAYGRPSPYQQGPQGYYEQGCYPNQGYCQSSGYGGPCRAPYMHGGPVPGPGYGMEYGPSGGYGYGGPQYQQPMYNAQPAYGQQQAGGGAGYGKMAMAAAGGVAAGAGAMMLMEHAGGIADGFGDVARFVGEGIEDVGGFAGHAMEDVGDFIGDGLQDIGRLF